ncbi:major tail protein [Clostridium baratii]|uniref:major tail protein n=1 Tax=Clostridium baratii TaxID=1561 RepID=UPI0030D2CDFC
MAEARKKEGCCNCMVAFLNEDGVTFLGPEALTDLEELSYTYTYAEGENYADNKRNIYRKKPTGADITLTFSDIKSKMVAKLLGKKYLKGGYTTNTNEKAPAVALLFQENYSDGSYINTVFYNSKFARDENSAKSSTENIEFSGITLTGKASPFKNNRVNGDIDFRLDSAAEDVDSTKLENFFKKVQYLEGDAETVMSLSEKGNDNEGAIKDDTQKVKETLESDVQEIKEKEVKIKGSKSNTGKEKE